jgi:hypothetical protein
MVPKEELDCRMGRVQSRGTQEPEQARTQNEKAEGQPLRFPRFCRVDVGNLLFPDETVVGQATADDSVNHKSEEIRVGQSALV